MWWTHEELLYKNKIDNCSPKDYVILLTKQCVSVQFTLEGSRTSILRGQLFIAQERTKELLLLLMGGCVIVLSNQWLIYLKNMSHPSVLLETWQVVSRFFKVMRWVGTRPGNDNNRGNRRETWLGMRQGCSQEWDGIGLWLRG